LTHQDQSGLRNLHRLEDAKVVLDPTRSRPGKDDFTNMQPHAEALSDCCNQEVFFRRRCHWPPRRERIAKVERGQVLVLDNLRFCAEENVDDIPEKLLKTHFVRQLSPLFDLNINDAFATATDHNQALWDSQMHSERRRTTNGKRTQSSLRTTRRTQTTMRYVLGGSKVEDKIQS